MTIKRSIGFPITCSFCSGPVCTVLVEDSNEQSIIVKRFLEQEIEGIVCPYCASQMPTSDIDT